MEPVLSYKNQTQVMTRAAGLCRRYKGDSESSLPQNANQIYILTLGNDR